MSKTATWGMPGSARRASASASSAGLHVQRRELDERRAAAATTLVVDERRLDEPVAAVNDSVRDGGDRRGASSIDVDSAGALVRVDDAQLEARRAGVDDEDVAQPGHVQSRISGIVVAVLARVRPRGEPPFGHVLAQMRCTVGEARHAVDHVDHEVEPVEVVEHDHVERRRRRAFLLVAADVEVRVVRAAVRQPVDQPRIAVVGEHDRLRVGEERVELGVRESVRMLVVRLEAHQVDHVDDAHLQLGKVLAQDRRLPRASRASGRRRSTP